MTAAWPPSSATFSPAFDSNMELLQDKHCLPFLKNCFLDFLSFLIAWEGSCQEKTGRRLIQTDLGSDMQNMLCRLAVSGGMREQEGHLPGSAWKVCGRHRPHCLAPQEQTGSWQYIAAPELQPGTRVHMISNRHVIILQC